ncbi:MAG: hypothetical protein C4558_04895 [Dehalococcoidia bacterium]|nr:MAG: hypothetical protein C4558_04895 [Dehalococcoidia bacterium]
MRHPSLALVLLLAFTVACGQIRVPGSSPPSTEVEATQRGDADSLVRSFRVVPSNDGTATYHFAFAPTAKAPIIAGRLTPGTAKSAVFEIDRLTPGNGKSKITVVSNNDGLPLSVTSGGKTVHLDWSQWPSGILGVRASATGASTAVPLTPQVRTAIDRAVQQIRTARVSAVPPAGGRTSHAIGYTADSRVVVAVLPTPIVRYVQLTDKDGRNRNLDSRVVSVSCSAPFICRWAALGAGAGNYGVPVSLEFARAITVPEDAPGLERNTAACLEAAGEVNVRTLIVGGGLVILTGLTTTTAAPIVTPILGAAALVELDGVLNAIGTAQVLGAAAATYMGNGDCQEAAVNWVAEDLARDAKATTSITICFETTVEPRARGCHRESGIVPAGDYQDKTVSLRLGDAGASTLASEPTCPPRFGRLPLADNSGVMGQISGGRVVQKSMVCTYQDNETKDFKVLNRVTRIALWWIEQPLPEGAGPGEYCAGADQTAEFPGFGGPTRAVRIYSPDRLARGESYRDFGMIDDAEAVRIVRALVEQAATRAAPCPQQTPR